MDLGSAIGWDRTRAIAKNMRPKRPSHEWLRNTADERAEIFGLGESPGNGGTSRKGDFVRGARPSHVLLRNAADVWAEISGLCESLENGVTSRKGDFVREQRPSRVWLRNIADYCAEIFVLCESPGNGVTSRKEDFVQLEGLVRDFVAFRGYSAPRTTSSLSFRSTLYRASIPAARRGSVHHRTGDAFRDGWRQARQRGEVRQFATLDGGLT